MTLRTKIEIKMHKGLAWLDYYSLHIALAAVTMSLIALSGTIIALKIYYG